MFSLLFVIYMQISRRSFDFGIKETGQIGSLSLKTVSIKTKSDETIDPIMFRVSITSEKGAGYWACLSR